MDSLLASGGTQAECMRSRLVDDYAHRQLRNAALAGRGISTVSIDFPHRYPDYALLSAWNHATEIRDKERPISLPPADAVASSARGRNCCVIIQ
jgi:hypothetical protein